MSAQSAHLHQYVPPTAAKQDQGSLRLILTLLFAHKWLLLLVPAVCAGVVAVIGPLVPPIYQGGFSVLIKAPEIDPSLVGENAEVVYKAGRIEDSMRTDEFHILNNRGTIEAAVSAYLSDHPAPTGYWAGALPAWRGQTEAAEGSAEQDQIKQELSAVLASSLEVTPIKESNIIQMRLHHHDRAFLDRIVDLFADQYLRYRRSVWVSSESREFYRKQADAMLRDWQAQLERQDALRVQIRGIDAGLDDTALANRLGQVQSDLDHVDQALAHHRVMRETLQGLAPEQALDFAPEPIRDSALLDPLKAAIGQAQADYRAASAVHAASSQVLSNHRERGEALRAEYKASLLRLLDSRIDQLEIERQLALEKIENDEQRLRRIEALQHQWTVGDEQAELLRAQYESRRLKLHEVEIHHLLRDSIENAVSLVSPPSTEAAPIWPKVGRMIATAIVLGLVLTIMFLLVRYFSQDAYWLPEDVSRDLGLPVLASLGYRSSR